MIDLHCHLDLYPEPTEVIRECVRRGMYVLSVTTTPSAWQGTAALSAGLERIRTALGLHPQLAHERKSELAQFDRLVHETRYVGEIGLDGTPECLAYWSDQVEVFEHILATCASAGGRILTIHSRRAEAEVLKRLEQQPRAGTPVLHWFSGTRRHLEHAIAIGCWFSVGPAMLAGRKGRELVERMPQDRVLTETDGPFAVSDGHPAAPWDAASAVLRLAEVWNLSSEEADRVLLANLRSLVQVVERDDRGAASH